jgi:hypothetical protein
VGDRVRLITPIPLRAVEPVSVSDSQEGRCLEVKNLAAAGILGLAVLVGSGLCLAQVTVSTSLSGPASVAVGQEASWDITIEVTTTADVTDVVVQDGMGADLDGIVVGTPTQGTASGAKRGHGKMGATMVIWDVGDLTAGQTESLVVTVTTGYNPKGYHEFTTAELAHELDGGASATYWYMGVEYESLETLPLTVDVTE